MSLNVNNVSQQNSNNGKICSIGCKDLNNDGKKDNYITIYEGETSKTYIDFDNDGYYDSVVKKGLDNNGKPYTKHSVEEPISDIKARPHFDSELYNRKLDTIQNSIFGGYLMMNQK